MSFTITKWSATTDFAFLFSWVVFYHVYSGKYEMNCSWLGYCFFFAFALSLSIHSLMQTHCSFRFVIVTIALFSHFYFCKSVKSENSNLWSRIATVVNWNGKREKSFIHKHGKYCTNFEWNTKVVYIEWKSFYTTDKEIKSKKKCTEKHVMAVRREKEAERAKLQQNAFGVLLTVFFVDFVSKHQREQFHHQYKWKDFLKLHLLIFVQLWNYAIEWLWI